MFLKALSNSNRVIFSGIQPTSIPHIGNYFGAIKEWINIQNSLSQNERLIISIVDLHAITLPREAKTLKFIAHL